MPVDHVMGAFYCCRKAVYEDLGGYDEQFLRGQTIDFGLQARLRGWQCLAVPDIEYIHAHTLRGHRQTEAANGQFHHHPHGVQSLLATDQNQGYTQTQLRRHTRRTHSK